MRARVPLDVDLEDRLLYGLTPVRLAYLVIAGLAGLAVWSARWPVAPVRGFIAMLALGTGAALAWGRWRGRPADGWVADFAHFVMATKRLRWDRGWRPQLRRRAPVVTGESPESADDEVAAA